MKAAKNNILVKQFKHLKVFTLFAWAKGRLCACAYTFFVAFFLLLSGSSFSQTSLYSTNFGTTSTFPSGWSATNGSFTNNNAVISSGYTGASAGYNGFFLNSAFSSNLTYSTISTVGVSNITVLWGARYTGSATLTVNLQWSINGTNWNNVAFSNVTNNSTWALVNWGNRISLPAGAEGQSTLFIRFAVTASATGSNTSYRIDDFNVKGDCSISQVPTNSLIANYKFNGNAIDETNNNNGNLVNNPTSSTDRFNVPGSAYTFNGTNQYVTTANSYPNPTNFTISVWFKTTTTTGGKLIGFGNSQAGTSSNYDRHIYMNNTGQVYFGVYPNAVRTVNTTTSYNDGTWHMATASLSSATGMALYMDGVLVASDAATTTAQNYTGYWKIVWDNMSGWPSPPTANYYDGQLDNILIYHRALNASEITSLYNSADGAGNNGPVCWGSPLNLTATTIPGASYSWTGPNSFNSTAQNPILTASASTAGVYTVNVNYNVCTSTAYTLIQNNASSSSISYAGSPFCRTGTASVTRSGASGGTYSRSPAGLTVNATTGALTLSSSTAGSYTVTYTVGGCSSSTTVVVNNNVATPVFALGATSTRCRAAGSVTYTATAPNSTGISYTLDATSLAAGNTINASTGAVTFTAAWSGTSIITATATGCVGPTNATHTVTISGTVWVNGTSTFTCVGGSTGTITASASGGTAPYSYNINGGSYQGTATFTGLSAGTYTINAQAANGCIASTTVQVTPFPASNDDQTVTGTNSWIGHVYDGIAFNSYYGQYTEPETFNQNFAGNTNCFTISSGGSNREVYTETFSVRYRMNSSRKGLFVADLGSDDGTRLYIDASLVHNDWSDHGFVNRPSVLFNLSGSSALVYEFYENASGNQVAFQNLTLILANTLSSNTSQAICVGNSGSDIAGDMYGILPPGITLSGTGYQWSYSTTPGGARTNIAGATGATFTPNAAVAPFNSPGTYYLYRNAAVISTNNTGVANYTATNESNSAVITVNAPPGATISYSGSPYCNGSGTATVTSTGTAGGTYSSSTGLSINASTGAVNLAASTPGTYTVTYTVAASGGCSVFTTTANITITQQPNASGYYAGSPYCSNGGFVSPTVTNLVGATGTLTSTLGLIFDVNGQVNLGASTPGSYTITYTVPAQGGCAQFTYQTPIAINAAPSASISYASNPVCSNAGPVSVTQSGNTGGTYSSTSGLAINTTTGVVTPSSSTPGTYTVTYTIAASGGCAVYTSTTSINIVGLPVVNNPDVSICSGSSTAINLTSTYAANFSWTIGTVTGGVTGAVAGSGNSIQQTLVNTGSTLGSVQYIVTPVAQALGSCSGPSKTITVTVAPTTTIAYGATSFCANAANGSPVVTGISGGSFSSSAGLSLNAATGEINFATSTPGSYTVTYSIPAVGSCTGQTAVAMVTITPQPSATISYPQSSYCSSNPGTVSPTIAGTGGGIFTSAPAGLSINASTGEVNIAASDPTTRAYTITYTVPASGGCSAFSTSTNFTITTQPYATGYYVGSPFCSNGGIVYPSGAQIQGAFGTLSSSTGLVFVDSYGGINLGTSTPGTYTITYTVPASGGCSLYSATTSITILAAGTWTGAINTAWENSGNWLCGGVPTANTNVTIPANLSNYPVVSTNSNAVKKLRIESGASVTVTGILQVTDSIKNTGTLDVQMGTIEMKGNAAQVLPTNVFVSSKIKSLIINNTTSVTLQGPLNLFDALTLTNGQLNSNGYLTLKSSDTATARVAPITSLAAMPVVGDVTVERYIKGRRKYRLMTSSVTTSPLAILAPAQANRSIWGNWQNADDTTQAGIGTFITGGTVADGYDQGTSNASLFTYDAINRKYLPYTSAAGNNSKFTPLKAGVPYYMFVYGDRKNSVIATTPNNTLLKATGTLTTGNQTYNTNSAISLSTVPGRFTMLGNPFASPIDWALLPKTDIENSYWGWDPNLNNTGGYVTISQIGSLTISSPYSGATGLSQHIQPGQGFFVRTSGPAPSLSIREQDKSTNFNNLAFREQTGGVPLVAINLVYTSGPNTLLSDGAVVAFDVSFSKQNGSEDVVKMLNSTETVALNNGNLLSVEGRPLPTAPDTLFVNFSKLARPVYKWQIFFKDMDGTNLQPYLVDKYLNSRTPLSVTDTNLVSFSINPGVPASVDAGRFQLVFKPAFLLAAENVVLHGKKIENDVQLSWQASGEDATTSYQVQHSVNGTDFKVATTIGVNNLLNRKYYWLDVDGETGDNFYRIKVLKNNSMAYYSNTVMIKLDEQKGYVKVFPNPVKGHAIKVDFGRLSKGYYVLELVNEKGQQIQQWPLLHAGGSKSYEIQTKKRIPGGMYVLKISDHQNKFTYNKHILFAN